MKEADVINLVRLEASQSGVHLFRNNVGATYTREGSFIRYGLCNESSAVNAVCKSADLIGIKPIVIEPWMVGATLGIFVSRECKHSNWKLGESPDRERAQIAWRNLINSLGGDAMIVSGKGSF